MQWSTSQWLNHETDGYGCIILSPLWCGRKTIFFATSCVQWKLHDKFQCLSTVCHSDNSIILGWQRGKTMHIPPSRFVLTCCLRFLFLIIYTGFLYTCQNNLFMIHLPWLTSATSYYFRWLMSHFEMQWLACLCGTPSGRIELRVIGLWVPSIISSVYLLPFWNITPQ